MSLPSLKDVKIALLEQIEKAGGKAEWKTLSPRVAAQFPEITEVDLAKKTRDGRR